VNCCTGKVSGTCKPTGTGPGLSGSAWAFSTPESVKKPNAPQINAEGQRRLLDSRVLIVGLGGLGSPLAMYLAASGVGTLVLSDFDFVELSNLQRQIIHRTAALGTDKVDSARRTLHELNPEVQVIPLASALDDDELGAQIALCDVAVDACDNFDTRFTMNALCRKAGKPLVSAAAVRNEAQVSVFDPRQPQSPCYRCLYGAGPGQGPEGEACARVGVLAPMLGIIGSIQATEVLKLLVPFGTPLVGRVLVLDAAQMAWHSLVLKKDPACPVCSA